MAIQREAYNQTPTRAERPQPPQIDLLGLLALMQQGTQRNIQEARSPIGQIAESPHNRPRYDVMSDPNYKPFANPQYGQVGNDVLVQSNAAQPMSQGQPQGQPNVGQGFQGILPGGIPWSADQPVSTLPGAPQPARPSFPGGVNPLTGLPPNTLPGDAGYRPDALNTQPQVVQPQVSQQPGSAPAQPQVQRDPQIQNLIDLSLQMRDYRNANPQLQQQPTSMFGAQPVTDAGDQSFYPGSAPNWRPGQNVGGAQPPPQLNTVEGFNQPLESQSPGGFQSLLNVSTVPSAVSGQAARGFANAERIVGHAQGAYQAAQNATATAGDLAQGVRGASTMGQYAANAAGSPAFNAALKAEQAAAGTAAGSLKSLQGMERVAGALGGTGKAAGVLQGVGKVAAPLQAGMMGLEAGRLAFDPNFRAQSQANYQSLGDKGAMAGLGQGIAAPVSTIANSGAGLWGLLQQLTDNSFQEGHIQKQASRPGAKKAMQRMKERQQTNR